MPVQVNKWVVAFTVMLPVLMVIIDTSVVNVSLDHIRGSLSAGIDETTWSITSYLAANAIVIPMTGWLSRLIGRKRFFMLSVILFTISSFLCGISWNIQSLVAFRVLQGLAGGSMQPISQSILLETFPPKQHGMAMAIFGIGIMFGPIIGPLLGGWITDNLSWHWVFFINIPIGALSILMSLFFIFDPHYMQKKSMKIDYVGLLLLALGVGCLQIVLDRGQKNDWFSSQMVIYLTLISVFSLVLFVIKELFAEHRIIDLKVFRSYSFSLGNLALGVFMVNLFGTLVLLPIYLQTLMGYTATLAGVVLAPGGVATLFAMPFVGRLVSQHNPKILLIPGILLVAYSTFLMAQFNLLVDFDTILWPRIIMGLGMGMIFIPLTTLTLSDIKIEELPNATSIYNLVRNLGGSFGIAIVTTLLNRRAQFHQARLVDHLTPFDMNYNLRVQQGTDALLGRGVDPLIAKQGSLGIMYERLIKEAAMMSFADVFYILAILMIVLIPIILFMKKPDYHKPKLSVSE